jgi:hypothetical protein
MEGMEKTEKNGIMESMEKMEILEKGGKKTIK